MSNSYKIGIVGGGSWATAIAKILMETQDGLNWFMRKDESIELFKQDAHNPHYLRDVEFDVENIFFSSDINKIVEASDIIVMAIPSAFIMDALKDLTVSLNDKIIVSAIKGLIPDRNMIVGEFFNEHMNVPLENMAVISGPCHAEEIALERLSYLTFSCCDIKRAKMLADTFACKYVKTCASEDIYGTEYGAVLKNVFALAAGICHGLRYGDNFQAVLISNSIQEMKRFVDTVHPIDRDIKSSAYLGDLLVTGYSQFSRNRTFGTMIGKGYSVKFAQLEMHMIAEGYFGVNGIYEINKRYNVRMPITDAVYNILYKNVPAALAMEKLSEQLR
ncbi:MAG: NAD(P)H-dependent glycerol-3-phosphate dehydrogenase [Marinifilaceae bacterium]